MSIQNMLRGQIWLYDSNPSIGDEIGKIRPAIIVNNNEIGVLRLKVVVPITGWNNAFVDVPWLVRIEPDIDNGLSKTSVADTFQVRSISQQRLIKQLGLLPVTTMTEISQALARVLSIGESI
ncbi:type II toxin-antitoxin system PemK/MazF family toxin [Chamaesiphon sp. OTE_75_metabat_556]|jgi:mRNA interferase MazF|uniref:type II toxin-antitoxin system PemK/MazF family toxin n=1 Tax=Chamaesiphon sp. OTE_75_metabat_556 TaxID=2964692 RepID=UPI00286B091E|nr:type II toxin-antitoxin system PemK/MazF family toxin [Chamaesiphon sp. OTE_75_metabat_556]